MDKNHDVEINSRDITFMSSFDGYMVGYMSDIHPFEETKREVLSKVKEFLPKSKGILVRVVTHPDTHIGLIEEFMEEVYDLARDEEVEVVLNTETHDDIEVDNFKICIIGGGLEKVH
jgi:cell division GTPase FtsZ